MKKNFRVVLMAVTYVCVLYTGGNSVPAYPAFLSIKKTSVVPVAKCALE
jgi:hypothetical protein